MLIDDWEIDVEKLPGPKRGKYPILYFHDKIFSSPTGNVAAVIYTISEIRMGWEIGLFALFENKSNPKCILNPNDLKCFSMKDTVVWLSNELFALKKYFYDQLKNDIEIPFAVVDTAKEQFCFLPIKNSIPYSIEVESNGFRLKEKYKDDIFPSEDNRFFFYEDLLWYRNQNLFRFDEFYTNQKQ